MTQVTPDTVKRFVSKRELDEEQREVNWKAVLDTYEGRAVFWDILTLCSIYDAGFLPSEHSLYRDGKRAVGVTIIEDLEEVAPNAYSRMREEYIERKYRNKNG